jgi:hypothetical protein
VELPGVGVKDGTEVPIKESTERWTEITLEDGAVLRLKPVVLSAVRIADAFDAEGNPLYQLRVNQIMAVASVPPHLRKDAEKGKDRPF